MTTTIEPTVRVTVPATTEYVRLARLNAAGLAADVGFSVEEIEDLRVAVDELFFLLVGEEGERTVEIDYHVDNEALVIHGRRRGASIGPSSAVVDDLVREILGVTVDEWHVDSDEAGLRFELVKRRRLAP